MDIAETELALADNASWGDMLKIGFQGHMIACK